MFSFPPVFHGYPWRIFSGHCRSYIMYSHYADHNEYYKVLVIVVYERIELTNLIYVEFLSSTIEYSRWTSNYARIRCIYYGSYFSTTGQYILIHYSFRQANPIRLSVAPYFENFKRSFINCICFPMFCSRL